MPSRIGNITFAADDPARLASFWAEALGYALQHAPPDFMEAWVAAGRDPNGAAAAVDPDGHGPRLFFQKKEKTRTQVIPVHLDLRAEHPEAEIERLVSIGATEVERRSERTGESETRWAVMRDPEGNGFCMGLGASGPAS